MKTYRKLLGGRRRSSSRDFVYIEQVRGFALKFDQFRLCSLRCSVSRWENQATCLLNPLPLPRGVVLHANSLQDNSQTKAT